MPDPRRRPHYRRLTSPTNPSDKRPHVVDAVDIAGASAALVAHLNEGTSPRWKAMTLGIYFGFGGGVGMVVPGILVPVVLDRADWAMAWVALGVVSLVAFAISAAAATAVPSTKPASAGEERGRKAWPVRTIVPLLVAYGLFGAGYIVYMTFVVSYLEQQGVERGRIQMFWVSLGLAAMVGAFVWSPVFARLSGGRGPALTLLTGMAGSLLPLVSDAAVVAYSSAALFGISFLATVTAITSCAQRVLEPRHWTSAFALLTVLFSLGQCVGPVLSGIVSDGGKGVRLGLVVGAVFLLMSCVAALFQRGARRPVAIVAQR